jgi:subtilisin family serine protease
MFQPESMDGIDIQNYRWQNQSQAFIGCVRFAAYPVFRSIMQQNYPALAASMQRVHQRAGSDRVCVQLQLREHDYQELQERDNLHFLALEPVPMLARLDGSIIKMQLHHLRRLEQLHGLQSDADILSREKDSSFHPLLADLNAYPSTNSEETGTDSNSAPSLLLSVIFRQGLTRVQQEQIITNWRTKLRKVKFSSSSALISSMDITHSRAKVRNNSNTFRKIPPASVSGNFHRETRSQDMFAHLTSARHFDHLLNSDFTAQCMQLPRTSIRLSKRGAFVDLPSELTHSFHHNSGISARVNSMFCLNNLVRIIASSPEVVRMGYSKPLQLLNHYARPILQGGSFVAGNEIYTSAGLNGSGVVFGVSDTGVDENSCFFQDKQRGKVKRTTIEEAYFDLSKRKVIQYVNYSGSSGDYASGHGSHVSGTLAGYCSLDDSNAGSMNTYHGMSSAAKLAFFDIGALGNELVVPFDLGVEVFAPAYSAGARIHSNSWGGGYFYDAYALAVDEYISDVRPDFTVFFAGGNNGASGRQTILSPGVAKNVIAVGATETGHSNGQNIDRIAFFSSTGPTYDNRLKPDVLAPGYSLFSARSKSEESPMNSCEIESKAGTSMATPALAGTAGLIEQYFIKDAARFWKKFCNPDAPFCRSGKAPLSAAMMKALILHGAQAVQMYNSRSEKVLLTDHHPPDNYQGYGRFVMRNILPLVEYQSGDSYLFLQQNALYELTEDVYQVEVGSTSNYPLRVTIAWSDPANDIFLAQLLQHDLDLEVISPNGTLFKGNAPIGTDSNGVERPAFGSSRDEDNVNEQVTIQHPQPGMWTLKVQMKYMMHPFVQRADGSSKSVDASNQKATQNYAMVLSTDGIVTRTAEQQTISADQFAPESQCAMYWQIDNTENAEIGSYDLGVALWSRVKTAAWYTDDYVWINQTRFGSTISSTTSSGGGKADSYPKVVLKATFPTNALTKKLPVSYSHYCLPPGEYKTELHLTPSVTLPGTQASFPDCEIFVAPFSTVESFHINAPLQNNLSHPAHTRRLHCLPSIVFSNHLTLTLNLTEYYGGSGWSGAYYTLIPKPSSLVTSRIAGTMEWNYELQKKLRVPLPSTNIANDAEDEQCYMLYLSAMLNSDLASDEAPEVYFVNGQLLSSDASSLMDCPYFLNQTNAIASFCLPSVQITGDVTVEMLFYHSSAQVPANYGQSPLGSSETEFSQLWDWMAQSPVLGTCLVPLKYVMAVSFEDDGDAVESIANADEVSPSSIPSLLPSIAPFAAVTGTTGYPTMVVSSLNPTRGETVPPTISALATGLSYGGRDLSCLSKCFGFPGNATLKHDLDKTCLFMNLLILRKCDSYSLSQGQCVVPSCVSDNCDGMKLHDMWCYLAGGSVQSCPPARQEIHATDFGIGDEVDDHGLVWRFSSSSEANQVYSHCMASKLLTTGSESSSSTNTPSNSLNNNTTVTILAVIAALLTLAIVVLLSLQAYHYATSSSSASMSTSIADSIHEGGGSAQYSSKQKRKLTQRGYEMVEMTSGSEHGDGGYDDEENNIRANAFTIRNHPDDEDSEEEEDDDEENFHQGRELILNPLGSKIPKIAAPPTSHSAISQESTTSSIQMDHDIIQNPMLFVSTSSVKEECQRQLEKMSSGDPPFSTLSNGGVSPNPLPPWSTNTAVPLQTKSEISSPMEDAAFFALEDESELVLSKEQSSDVSTARVASFSSIPDAPANAEISEDGDDDDNVQL